MSKITKLSSGNRSLPPQKYKVGNYNPDSGVKHSSTPAEGDGGGFNFQRVLEVVTEIDHPLYKQIGTKALGAVFLQDMSSNVIDKPKELDYYSTDVIIAYPLFPNIKNYPLKNEIVITISGPDFTTQSSTKSSTLYYICSYNIWNNNHHNALPDTRESDNDDNLTNKDYINKVPVNQGAGGSDDVDLGKYFEENEDIKNLLAFEGDIIHEGRFGNSIRFSSTIKNTQSNNQWSEAGKNGDPITIVRVSKPIREAPNKKLTMEDINIDDSSIYITSTQKIPIDVNFL